MSINSPFQQTGNTVKVAAVGAAGTQSDVYTITSNSPSQQYFISNADTNAAVYVRINVTSVFNVSLPDTTPNFVLALPPYAYKVITGPQVGPGNDVYARVIGDSTNASVYVTPGYGS